MNTGSTSTAPATDPGIGAKLFLAWAFVGIPRLWGVILTCINAAKLFQ
jgi:hypothetical protein